MKRTIFLAVSSLLLISLCLGCVTVAPSQDDPMEVLRTSTVALDGTAIPIDADYILLYYAADWCPYCIAYTEQLKSSYAALKSLYGGSFDLIFVGHANDTSNEQLTAFLEAGGYPFTYLPIEKREATGVMELCGEARFYIPGLLLIDRTGKVLASSNGESIDDYLRDRPIYTLQNLKLQDCASCQRE